MSLRELKSLWNDIEDRSSAGRPTQSSRYGLRRTKTRDDDNDGTAIINQDIFRETSALYDLRRIVSGDNNESDPSTSNPNEYNKGTTEKRKKGLLEEDAKFAKRIKDSSASVAKAYTCPLTGDLLYSPVMIEGDGTTLYERKAIVDYIDKRTNGKPGSVIAISSPVSNKLVGTTIIPAYQARDAIFHLVESGMLDNHLTDMWRDLMATKKESDSGNPRAMVDLAYILTDPDGDGARCPSPDEEKKAYVLWQRAADLGDPEGMCEAGECFVEGNGVERDENVGIHLIEKAANAGYANASLSMALDHSMGLNGLEKSIDSAHRWARKALDTSSAWPLDDDEREIAQRLLASEDVAAGKKVDGED